MHPPILNALPIAKSILYEKRVLLNNLKRRCLTEKITPNRIVRPVKDNVYKT